MLKYRLLLTLLLSNFLASQILVDPSGKPESTLPLDDLIQEVLFSGCEQITNLKVKSGEPQGIKSYGYFEKGASDFNFNNGIVLSTGNVASVPAPFDNNKEDKIGEGNEVTGSWGGDTDLQKILNAQLGGNIQTYNSTSLEFDIIPLTDKISIDFIFGSNEYELMGDYECIDATTNFQDGFAFLISGPGITNDTGIDGKNIALIPGDNKAVGVGTIHNNKSCANIGREDLYVEGATKNTIDVNGYTVPLTAVQDVTPGLTYKIKIVLGERGDGKYDSFIFLAGDGFSFNIDLGEDQTICRGDEYILDAGDLSGLATYKWYKDGVEISGETSSKLKVSETGNYKAEAILSDCVLVDEVQITVEDLPAPRNLVYEECSKTEYAEFYLPNRNSEIIEGHENYTISFHKTFDDAEKNINPLPDNYTNEEPVTQTIYIRVESENGCVGYSRYKLIVNLKPEYKGTLSIDECDENQDGKEIFDLNPIKEEIINNSIATQVTFHLTEAQAISGQNPLPLLYETETRTIYARYITNTDCFEFIKVQLNVISGPEIEPVNDIFCDAEKDGEVIDLTSYETQLDSSLDYEYYLTEQNTIDQVNKIIDPTAVTVKETTTTFYVRTVSSTDSCESYTTITIELEYLPVLESLVLNYEVCDSEYDSEVPVQLDDVRMAIDSSNKYEIDFYLTQSDGENNINEITTPSYLVTTTNNQLIAKVYSGEKCYTYVTVDFVIKEKPQLATDSVIVKFCKDNGTVLFDLTTLEETFMADRAGVAITYHTSISDAENNLNPISNPTAYDIIKQGTIVYVRFASFETCSSIGEIRFEEQQGPVGKDIEDSFCIDEGSSLVIDLTEYEKEIVVDPIWSIVYYETLSDAENQVNPISDPSNYTLVNDKTLYQRIDSENNLGCYTISTLELKVSNLPTVQNTSLTECELDGDNSSTFILTNANEAIITNAEDYQFAYFLSTSDLENNVNELAVAYNSTGGETIYVKVEDNQTGCYSVAEIELIVSSADSSGSIEQIGCESDDNGFTTFDLSENDTAIFEIIEGTSIAYYASLSDADLQQNELPQNYTNTTAYNQTVYAKVKDGTVCKGVVEVNLVIIQNPILNVEKEVFKCPEDNVVLDAGEGHFSYEWSTGQTTQQITVEEPGSYTITVYNENGCSTTEVIVVENYEGPILVDLITGPDYIEAIVKNPSEYTYSIDGTNFQTNPRFTGIDDGIYTVYAKSSQGCITTLGTIGLITQDAIANVFTPNGDGFNDYWTVEGLDAFPEATVQVFSREGKEVLKTVVGNGFSWDGTFLGRRLPSNDYWYIIKLPDGKIFRSHLTLKNR
ncbi:valine--tRNA ligase [Flavobacteriaceae bacterium UJ101]|nr:valine--tRNA ligase [Flavobacteriaceae bacterium UJ101]